MTCHPRVKPNSVSAAAPLPQEGISIAKGYTSGPPLTFKAVSQLKWVDITVDDGDEAAAAAEVQSGPSNKMSNFLGLRDGSVILVKFQKDEFIMENQSSPKLSSKLGKSKLTSFKKNVNLTTEKPIVIHSKSIEEKQSVYVIFETTFSSLDSTSEPDRSNPTEPNLVRDESYVYRKDVSIKNDGVSNLKINNSTPSAVTSPAKSQDFDPPKLLSPTTSIVDKNSLKVMVPPVYLPDSVLLLGFPPQPKSDSN